MRRNFVMRYNVSMNLNMANYVSLALGRTVEDTPDIWCYLRKSYLGDEKAKNEPKATRHYERWLYNRDSAGHTPIYSEKIKIPKKPTRWLAWSRNRHPDHYYDYTARKTDIASGNPAMSFDVDDRWLSSSAQTVYIKITYTDRGKGKIQLEYKDSQDKLHTRFVGCSDSGSIRTSTFKIENINFNNRLGSGDNKMDFRILALGEDVTINFVRLVKASQ